MKKVAEFIEGTFIDYKGDEREYTILSLIHIPSPRDA